MISASVGFTPQYDRPSFSHHSLTKGDRVFAEIKDRREQQLLLARLEKLKHEPEKQGKALSEELAGYLYPMIRCQL